MQNSKEEFEREGFEVKKELRERERGKILPSCPWLDAAERIITQLGRPAAELTKLFAQQLDLYSLSPQEEAHKAFERKVEEETRDERVKLDLAMMAYTGSPVTPINEEVYRWASQVIETTKKYRDETYEMLQEVASMPRMVKVEDTRDKKFKEDGDYWEYYVWYVPRYRVWTDIVARRNTVTGRWYGVHRSQSAVLWEYQRKQMELMYSY